MPELSPDPTGDALARTATEWIVRRDRGLSVAEARAFDAWRAADPRHADALAEAEADWRGLDQIAAVPALAAMAEAAERGARARHERRERDRRKLVYFSAAFFAAAAAFAILLWGPWQRAAQPATAGYKVLASTAQRVELPDGSVAELNGDSRIEPAFTAGERRVRLLRGEAHFTVTKDAARPFIVVAGAVEVKAIGTAFNVRLASAAVEVVVTEGTVGVERVRSENGERKTENGSPPQSALSSVLGPPSSGLVLSAGERTSVSLEPAAPTPVVAVAAPAELEQALAWQTTRLVFDGTSLAAVVEAFNTHNPRRLVLGDEALRTRTLTGTFRADNLDGFARLLEASLDVRAEPRADGALVLHPAR